MSLGVRTHQCDRPLNSDTTTYMLTTSSVLSFAAFGSSERSCSWTARKKRTDTPLRTCIQGVANSPQLQTMGWDMRACVAVNGRTCWDSASSCFAADSGVAGGWFRFLDTMWNATTSTHARGVETGSSMSFWASACTRDSTLFATAATASSLVSTLSSKEEYHQSHAHHTRGTGSRNLPIEIEAKQLIVVGDRFAGDVAWSGCKLDTENEGHVVVR